jgi:hypothetical protein
LTAADKEVANGEFFEISLPIQHFYWHAFAQIYSMPNQSSSFGT